MRKIAEQIGEAFAAYRDEIRGYIVVSRPYEPDDRLKLYHEGTIGEFLEKNSNKQGCWIFEIVSASKTELFLVRWEESFKRWRNQGRVVYGVF